MPTIGLGSKHLANNLILNTLKASCGPPQIFKPPQPNKWRTHTHVYTARVENMGRIRTHTTTKYENSLYRSGFKVASAV
jgi:hypothetical protein